jgi:zinc D-Ala-D-Ala dipeptidase
MKTARMNLIKQRYFLLIVQTVFLSTPSFTQSPSLPLSKYGVPVLKDPAVYLELAKADSNRKLVELKSLIPSIMYDLRYASNNNFMRTNLYPAKWPYTYLRLPAARALAMVQKDLAARGMGLKIFDAYRPYSVTEKFWELVMDEKYVADPKKGSGHNRGLAVDLTLVYLGNGKEAQMPTGFDNFSDTAHHNFMNLPFDALQNRKLLKETMEKYGFKAFETEWWHYAWPDDLHYELLDIPFKELKKII